MIVDCHTHLSTNEQWGEVFLNEFAVAYKKSGIDLHVTPERHWKASASADKVIVFGINSQFLKMHTPNDQIADYASAHPDKVIGFMSIDPNESGAIEELERSVHDLNLRGIKMSPVYQYYEPMDQRVQEIYKRAVKYNLPILTHSAYHMIPQTPMKWANPLLFDEVGMCYPDLKVIIAHVGIPWYEDAMVVVRKHHNIYADISGIMTKPNWGYQALLAFHEFGISHKLLFGTDFPFVTVEATIEGLRNANQVLPDKGMTEIPQTLIEEIIHRETLTLLGLD